jgi:hypothetical protein
MPAARAVEFAHRTRTSAMEEMRAERVLPDYTWPQRMPIEVLRRIVTEEARRAAELVRQTFPTWD